MLRQSTYVSNENEIWAFFEGIPFLTPVREIDKLLKFHTRTARTDLGAPSEVIVAYERENGESCGTIETTSACGHNLFTCRTFERENHG